MSKSRPDSAEDVTRRMAMFHLVSHQKVGMQAQDNDSGPWGQPAALHDGTEYEVSDDACQSKANRSSQPQTILILQGLPGSGKSTFAHALVSASQSEDWSAFSFTSEVTGNPIPRHRKWVRASQDDAPNRKRQECEEVVRQALADGHNVVVDRVNFDRA